MENIILIIIATCTLSVAFLTFLASITDWFKRKIPIKFGFLYNNQIVPKIELASGDPAKPTFIRFYNSSKTTLTGIVLDIRFLKPISLSGTGSALTYIPGKTQHGRTEDESYYLIRHSELEIVGQSNMDFRIELNTQNKSPDKYFIIITVYSTQQTFKYNKATLIIEMK